MFAGLMLAYLYLKLTPGDVLLHTCPRASKRTHCLTTTPYGTTFWWLEIVGALIPATLADARAARQDPGCCSAGSYVGGVIANRWNVTLSGLVVPMDWSPGAAQLFSVQPYTPSLAEWGVAIGVLGYALTMFTLGLRFLPLFNHEAHGEH